MTSHRIRGMAIAIAMMIVSTNGNPLQADESMAMDGFRPARWAQPVQLKGVPNLHRITNQLYRSAQPSQAGMQQLEKLGIEISINFRSFHDDQDEIRGTNLIERRFPIKTWRLKDQQIVLILKCIKENQDRVVLLHCQHGADRTGMISAFYRMIFQNWTKDEALREMVDGGYGYHTVWTNIIDRIEEMDVAWLRNQVLGPEK